VTFRRSGRFGEVAASTLLALGLVATAWGQTATSTAGSPEARDLGIEEARAGRYREGYAHLLPWVKSNPRDHEARFYAAWAAAYLGRTFEAADLLSGLDEADPRVQFLWGKLLLDKRDPEGAIEVLLPLVDHPPPELEIDIRRILARALMDQGRAAEAVSLLEGRVEGDPSLALELALALYESGRVQEASDLLAPYAKTVLARLEAEERPPAGRLWVGLVYEYGRILVNAGKHSQAASFLESSVDLEPGCKQCWQHLAQAYAASGRHRDAQVAQTQFQEILRHQASAEQEQRQNAQDQRDPTGKVLREAEVVFGEGKQDEALAMLRAESQIRPEDPRTLLLAARWLVELERAADALGLAERAVMAAPAHADSYLVRGMVWQALGDMEQARLNYDRSLELAPSLAEASEALARLPPT
jgi:tetratricopeptide (TPR) repeat protein